MKKYGFLIRAFYVVCLLVLGIAIGYIGIAIGYNSKKSTKETITITDTLRIEDTLYVHDTVEVPKIVYKTICCQDNPSAYRFGRKTGHPKNCYNMKVDCK